MDIIVRHTVRDYDAWKAVFDAHEPERARYGCRGHSIYRDPDNPNDVTLFMSWESRERAEEFFNDPSLREAMEKGGVITEPLSSWLEQQETCTYARSRAA